MSRNRLHVRNRCSDTKQVREEELKAQIYYFMIYNGTVQKYILH